MGDGVTRSVCDNLCPANEIDKKVGQVAPEPS